MLPESGTIGKVELGNVLPLNGSKVQNKRPIGIKLSKDVNFNQLSPKKKTM